MEPEFLCSEAGKNYAVNVWSRDAVNFYLSVFIITAFSFSLFMWKPKKKQLFALLEHVENKYILYF